MADIARQTKKLKNLYVDWKNRPYSKDANAEQRRQHLERFEILNRFVTEYRGWIVSTPGNQHVRIEARENSGLPIRLAELGYKLRFCGTGTRPVFGGTTETTIDKHGRQSTRIDDGFVTTEFIEIRLDGK
jgi:hypothetical protein